MVHYKIMKWLVFYLYLMAVNITVINLTIKTDGDALLTGEVKMNEQCVNVMSCMNSLLLCYMETKSATSEENEVKSQHIFSQGEF